MYVLFQHGFVYRLAVYSIGVGVGVPYRCRIFIKLYTFLILYILERLCRKKQFLQKKKRKSQVYGKKRLVMVSGLA